ncbi:hypothetical protein GGR55DRAFT_689245 [Xylaria sp. FL0064]|nr:hypothetical protein GGR55DRAFT_689245 [Xylaria sp. FL0064]
MAPTNAKPKRGPRRRNYMKEQIGLKIDLNIVNDKPVLNNVEPCTEEGYARQLQNWDDLVESLRDLKEFVLRLGQAMRSGKEPHETLPWSGIKSYWKKFTAGYQRERGKIPAGHITMITQAIAPRGEIGRALNIVPDKGPRKHATAAAFIWVGEYLWSLDWKIFARPRLRMDLWACLSLAAYTAARVSDYIESSARSKSEVGLYYKDTTLILFQNERGESEFALQSTKFLKGHHPLSSKLLTPHIHEGGVFKRQPLYMNPMLFFLAIFYSKGALRDYRGTEDLSRLLNQKVSPGQSQILIHWDRSVLNQPIFSGPSGRILTANAFSKELRSAEMRAGFPDPPSLHCYRVEGLTNVDSNPMYSDTQRQRLAGHENNQIHQQYYSSRNPGIDSQAAYLGVQARGINIGELFRNLEVRWEPALWQSLPAAKQQELSQTKDYQEIVAQIQALSAAKCGRKSEESLAPAKLDSEERDLSSNESDSILAHPDHILCKGVNHPFSRLRPILPSRRQLADLLLTDATLRSPAGRAALDALIDLYNSKTEVDRRGLDPSNCSCRMFNPTQLHVYECKKKNSPFAEFCFFCNEWFSDPKAWEEHCRHHLEQDPLPVELGWQKIESTFLPGYCPFCLWDSRLAAARRLHQFCSPDEWEKHIRSHGIAWLARCPDERCAEPCDTHSFSHHIAELEGGSPARKIKIENQDDETQFVFEYCSEPAA